MSTNLAVRDTVGEAVERVMIAGDLSKLSPEERVNYYRSVCNSVGLNPLTRPLEYITLNGKLTLYARKDATDQLRANNQVSITISSREVVEGCYVVTARATMPSGRCDESIGALPIESLKGDARSNQMMKTETKAKRRVTLSICGMGMLDESEIDSIPGAKIGEVSAKVTEAPRVIAAPKAVEASVAYSDELSTLDQQKKFAMLFRDALPPKFQAHADQLRKAALAEAGYTNEKGEGSSKVIRRNDFQSVANKLIKTAGQMTDPFIPNDSDLPGNI